MFRHPEPTSSLGGGIARNEPLGWLLLDFLCTTSPSV